MLKKWNNFLNIAAGSTVGVFIGHGLYVFWEYRTCPGLYAMRSAPWYASILIYGAVTAGVLAAVLLAKWVIRRKGNGK